MRKLLTTLIFIIIFHCEATDLVKDSISDYSIYCAEDAIPAEKMAAEELQFFLEKISGAKLPITAKINHESGKRIYVGQSRPVKELLPGINWAILESDEIILQTSENALILCGGRPRGTLYAVYEWLEKQGVRFFAPDETFIPRKNTLPLENLNIRYAPKLKIREILYNQITDEVFAVRMKSNGHWKKISFAYGNHNQILGFCHTFDQLIPAKEFLATKPEWFSLVNGKRVGGQLRGQLCLSNIEMRKELIKRAAKWLRKHPDQKIISVSQNDNGFFCTCPQCRNLDTAEGSPAASIIQFVNIVAEELQKEFPDVIVETLAYTYSRKPPKTIRPRENTLIRLCSIEANVNRPITDPSNREFMNCLTGWEKISPRLGVWNYTANHTNAQILYPILPYLASDIKTYASRKVCYLFMEGNHYTQYGDLTELSVYLLSKLLWNPESNPTQLTKEFLSGYYKTAAPYMEKYLEIRQNESLHSRAYIDCYVDNANGWLSLKGLLNARQVISQAMEKVSSDPIVKERIERIAFSLNFALLQRSEFSIYDNTETGTALKRLVSPQMVFESASNYAKQYLKKYKEKAMRQTLDKIQESKRYFFKTERSAVPDFCKNLAETDWLDLQEETFLWLRSVKDPLASNGKAHKMENTRFSWTTQCPLPSFSGKWKIYVYLRIEGKKNTKFQIGIYNRIKRKEHGKYFKSEDYMDGKYHWIDFGKHIFSDSCYLFLASGPGIKVYTDRIVLVRMGD